MQARKREREQAVRPPELGVASKDTLGLPIGDEIEPMGFWRKTGISDE